MPKPFKKIVLFGKRRADKTIASTLLKVKKFLEQHHLTVFVEEETAELFGFKKCEVLAETQFKKNADLILVVGGDGSLLSAAQSAVTQNLPLLGINRGRLGFLTDIPPNDFSQLKKIVIDGEYQIEKRFLLAAKIIQNKKNLHQHIALNDFVLLPGDVAHMIEFSLYIDNEFVCTQLADGLIVTTPTGSTAYALSGGGPILHPKLNAIALVPMFPHKLTSRPIVISSHSNIEITVSVHNETFPRLSVDGQIKLPLAPEDKITISQHHRLLHLIHPIHYQYFSTLRTKLHWEYKPY